MDVERIVMEREFAWRDALAASDVGRMAEMISPDFYVEAAVEGGEPLRSNREEFLREMRRYRFSSVHIDDMHVQALADAAVVTLLWSQEAEWGGVPRAGLFLITDIWQRHDGTWRLASRHSSRPTHDRERSTG